MILYLGTSSLIKLYIEEVGSGIVRQWIHDAEIIATCRVAYSEVIDAINRRFREADLTEQVFNEVYEAFTTDWPNFAVVDFDDLEAGKLVKKYGLRRLDAIHLSSAMMIKKAGTSINLFFSSASVNLCSAATAEGIRVLSLS